MYLSGSEVTNDSLSKVGEIWLVASQKTLTSVYFGRKGFKLIFPAEPISYQCANYIVAAKGWPKKDA